MRKRTPPENEQTGENPLTGMCPAAGSHVFWGMDFGEDFRLKAPKRLAGGLQAFCSAQGFQKATYRSGSRLKAPKRFAADHVRSSPRGDFRELIGDQFRKVPFGERASHDAQLLTPPVSGNISLIYCRALPRGLVGIRIMRLVPFFVRAGKGSRRREASAAAK